MKNRAKIPLQLEADVITSSRRRCCVCYALHGDETEKKGQIAHLDQDPSNNALDNLAFLCFDHHDQYDSRTKQSKGLTIKEVKRYRDQLGAFVAKKLPRSDADSENKSVLPEITVEAPFTVMPAFAVVKFRVENKSQKKDNCLPGKIKCHANKY